MSSLIYARTMQHCECWSNFRQRLTWSWTGARSVRVLTTHAYAVDRRVRHRPTTVLYCARLRRNDRGLRNSHVVRLSALNLCAERETSVLRHKQVIAAIVLQDQHSDLNVIDTLHLH